MVPPGSPCTFPPASATRPIMEATSACSQVQQAICYPTNGNKDNGGLSTQAQNHPQICRSKMDRLDRDSRQETQIWHDIPFPGCCSECWVQSRSPRSGERWRYRASSWPDIVYREVDECLWISERSVVVFDRHQTKLKVVVYYYNRNFFNTPVVGHEDGTYLWSGVRPCVAFDTLANRGLFCERINEDLNAEPGTLSESEELGARIADPTSDIRGIAGGFLIVEGTGIFDRFPWGSPPSCITERRLESIL